MLEHEVIRVFGERPNRMELLKDSLSRIDLMQGNRVLEAGCSYGDGIACAIEKTGATGYGIDLSEEFVSEARSKHASIHFVAGSVYDLPYANTYFDLVFSQAAFSLLKKKESAVEEYKRVLKEGGYVIINDFVIKEEIDGMNLDEMNFIPCFNSVGTIASYVHLFKKAGFELILAEERYSEIIQTTLHLTKSFKCSPSEMAMLFSELLGQSENRVEQGMCFFRRAKVSYGQFIFRKA